MDHHGDHDMGGQCHMNMLFNWSYENLCIVFESWHITSIWQYLFSLVAIVALTAGYEGLREVSRRRVEMASMQSVALRNGVRDHNESSSLLWNSGSADRHTSNSDGAAAERRARMIDGVFYAVQVFYSFFIMLLFMTYNGGIMLAVAVGAFVGYVGFGAPSPSRSVACH